jgi:hypothetical protein
MSLPEAMDVTSRPAISGKSSSPDVVALTPVTICR